jgi:hypothetical protein
MMARRLGLRGRDDLSRDLEGHHLFFRKHRSRDRRE